MNAGFGFLKVCFHRRPTPWSYQRLAGTSHPESYLHYFDFLIRCVGVHQAMGDWKSKGETEELLTM